MIINLNVFVLRLNWICMRLQKKDVRRAVCGWCVRIGSRASDVYFVRQCEEDFLFEWAGNHAAHIFA